jgi:hypothetical protein
MVAQNGMLFEQPSKFEGLPEEGFETFAIPDRDTRRTAIIHTIHPALTVLGEDLLARLSPLAHEPLHVHLPRLDWPKEYQPFCTWLALSRRTHGYQSGPQLNLGIHADHVTARLGWDTASDFFGRFEFLCRHGEIGEMLLDLAAEEDFRFRIYGAAPWPQGSRCVVETPHDLTLIFREARERGVWWELGRRYGLPGAKPLVCSAAFGRDVAEIFAKLLPAYDRIVGEEHPLTAT